MIILKLDSKIKIKIKIVFIKIVYINRNAL